MKAKTKTQNAEILGRLMPPTAIKTYGSRRFIGLSVRSNIARELEHSMYEATVRLAGEGQLIKDENGVRVFDLVILDGTYDVLGDWIVRYSTDSESGVSVERVWIAAEIKDEREFTQWHGDSDGTVGVD